MIKFKVEPTEVFDEATERFVTLPGGVFRFEHCLKAIAKWEFKYCKSFLKTKEKTQEEALYYCYCMCLDDDFHYAYFNQTIIDKLMKYLGETHTATRLKKTEDTGGPSSSMTSEIIYASMFMAQVDMSCDEWELNRLLVMLEYIGRKNQVKEPKKNKKGKTNPGLYKKFYETNEARLRGK